MFVNMFPARLTERGSPVRKILILTLLLAACGVQPAVPTSFAPGVAVRTFTPSPSQTPFPSLTPSPSPLPFLMYPYTVDGMRERIYPGGIINLRTRLGLTDSYTRYLIDYPSDGLTITGILQVPPGDGPFPVILLNHGYFNRWEYTSGDGTDRLAEALNRVGYLTISSDYRGWAGSDTGLSMFYTGLAADVLNLLASLPSLPQADPARVGMLGHSMGGGVTAKVLVVDSGAHIRAAVFYATVSADDADVLARWGAGCIGDTAIAKCLGADTLPDGVAGELVDAYLQAAANPQTLGQISPINHLEFFGAPVQIHIGLFDGNVISGTPPEWSEKLFEALREAGKPVEIYRYSDQTHSFGGDSRDEFISRVIAFFDEHVR